MYRLKVKEIAQAKGMSQNKLSYKAEIDLKSLRKIMRNPQAIIQTDTLDRLAMALEVDISELIESIPVNSRDVQQ